MRFLTGHVLFSLQDGHELPPTIGFDLPSEESLPSSKAMHCCVNCIKNSSVFAQFSVHLQLTL